MWPSTSGKVALTLAFPSTDAFKARASCDLGIPSHRHPRLPFWRVGKNMITANPPVGITTHPERRAKIIDGLVLVMLGAFAITQPLLSDFRAGAGYFVARRNEPIEIVLLVVVSTVLPGLVANLIVWAADGFSERARVITHTAFVGLFSALIAQTTLVRLTSVNWVVLLVVSVLIGALAVWAYGRSRGFRTFLTYLIPAPLVFALFFLFTAPVSGFVFPASPEKIAADVESRTPVVFVVFDEFPVISLLDQSGDIDPVRFPNFASLASMSTWYKHTASAHESTLWAVPALLTGRSPDSSLLPTAADHPGNLFTLLDRSHQLHVIEPFTHLCPPEMCGQVAASSFGDRLTALMIDAVRLYQMLLTPDPSSSASVSDPFNEFSPEVADQAVQREFATDQVDRFGDFLDGINSSASGLHFIHLFLPHAPFRYYPSGVEYNDAGELDGREDEYWVDRVLANQAYQRHLLQVGKVDQMIGDLLARLDDVGVLDEAIMVVTADHGISFQPGQPRRPLVAENAYEVGMVPLFIKAPHQDGGNIVTTPSRTIDVLPTVASYLGLELPWKHEGQSLSVADRPVTSLTVQASNGSDVTLENVDQGLEAATSRMASVFGHEDGSIDVYSFGDYDSLIGSPSNGLAVGSSALRAQVDESWRFAHVAPYTGFVPGFVHGTLSGDVDAAPYLAIALNGVVRTVVEAFDVLGDRARFSAILPDTAFVSGFNDLEVFGISGPAESPSIRRVEVEGQRKFEMERASNGRVTRLVDSEGLSWRMEERAPIFGFVDGASWHDSGLPGGGTDLHLAGWAIDGIDSKPAERVVVFVNDVFAGTVEINQERPDIEDGYEIPEVLVSGFTSRLSQFLPAANLEVRAFALSDGLAEELPLTDSARAALASG